MVGGIIVDIYRDITNNEAQLLVRDGNDYCVVVACLQYAFKRGDKIWWQSGYHYWTRPIHRKLLGFKLPTKYQFVERKIKKIGYSTSWYKIKQTKTKDELDG